MLKRRFSVIGLACFLGLAAPQVWAQTNFTATLNQAQEVPPSGSPATGTANMFLNNAGDRLTYTIVINGLDLDGAQTADPGDDVVGMHFHNAPAGSNGPVVFGMISPNHDLDDLVIDPVTGTITGSWEESDNNGNALLSAQMADLLAGNLYINVHTAAIPSGEIRGQVTISNTPTQIPALGGVGIVALAALLAGLGAALLPRRRRG